MRWILFILLFVSTSSVAQWKDFIIGVKGDTLNRVDKMGLKQGPWVHKYETVRGERGYEEEGEYKDDLKEGNWRKYSLMGDLLAIENYRWGFPQTCGAKFSGCMPSFCRRAIRRC